MNNSISSLENFIDSVYDSVNMPQSTRVPLNTIAGLKHQSTPAPATDEDDKDARKKRRIGSLTSPISPLSDSNEYNHLTKGQRTIFDSVINATSAKIGEFMNSLQESLNYQLEEAVESIHNEIEARLSKSHTDFSVDVNDAIANQTHDMRDLQEENSELLTKCQVLEGRLTRTEKEVTELKERLLLQEARSMRDNLKFYGLAEVTGENCEITLKTFMKREMKISEEDLKKISFDRVHRTAERNREKHRVIVAKFNPSEGRQIVLQHCRNIPRNKGYSVSEQLPRELAERKKMLLPSFKKAKEEKKQPKWSLDKLVIGQKMQQVPKDKVHDINMNTAEVAAAMIDNAKHAALQTHKGTSFQGHSVSIGNQDDVVPALHAFYSDPRIARASCNPYAYRIKTNSGYIEHYVDDGEWGAGVKLLQMLKTNNVANKLICVTSWHGNQYLGKSKYDLIIKSAEATLGTRP